MKEKYEKYSEELRTLKETLDGENREPTQDEMKRVTYLLDLLDSVDNGVEIFGAADPEKARAMIPDIGGFERSTGQPYTLRGPGEKKNYRRLFGSQDAVTWDYKDMNFWQALFSGRAHPGLNQRATMQEGIGSAGGFLVPTEFVKAIHDVALENEIVAPLAYVQPMKSNQIEIPAFDIGSHTSHLHGGFIAAYAAELATITQTEPKVRRMELNANKLTGLMRFSNELIADAGTDKIVEVCGKGLAWYRDVNFLNGTGAGRPLGVLQATCTIATSKEVGQAANTIVYENLTNMLANLYTGSFKNAVWVCHQTTLPQLLSLGIPVGAGGSHYPVLSESGGKYLMLTRPVIFTEKTETLGTQGDILLADFSQYVIGLREGMRVDHSPHVGFSTDSHYTRIIERHDGQPLWDEYLTLKDGSTTVSPFVVLEDR